MPHAGTEDKKTAQKQILGTTVSEQNSFYKIQLYNSSLNVHIACIY